VRAVLATVFGLGLGMLASSLTWSGCGCPSGTPHPDLVGGQRLVLPSVADGDAADYELRVSGDAKSLVETFTQGGKRYEIHYAVGERTEIGG